MGESKTWGEFYSKPASALFSVRDVFVHLRYLLAIILRRPRRILEIGAGTGIQSIFLSHFAKNVITVDSDKRVVANTRVNVKHSKAEVNLILGDAFLTPFRDKSFDVCYSQGFLEHFSDEEIVKLLKEQLRVSESLVHSVPSDHYPWRQFGDERHLSPSAWHNLVSKCLGENSNMTIQVKYGYLPFVNWYIIINVKTETAQSDS